MLDFRPSREPDPLSSLQVSILYTTTRLLMWLHLPFWVLLQLTDLPEHKLRVITAEPEDTRSAPGGLWLPKSYIVTSATCALTTACRICARQ